MKICLYFLAAAASGTFAALVSSNEKQPWQATIASADSSKRYNAYVQIENKLPIKVSFGLDHFRGLDFFGTNETKAWHGIGPGESTAKWKISYEKAREHFDYWQIFVDLVNINSKWTFASTRIFNPLGVEDNGTTLDFKICNDEFQTAVNSRINGVASAPIDIAYESPEQPPQSPTSINSFTFLKINNTLDTLEYVQAILNPDQESEYLQQRQLYKQVPLGVQDDSSSLPFFFEKNNDKDFNESWLFIIKPKNRGRIMSDRTICRLPAWVAGQVLSVNLAENGWSIADTGCKALWPSAHESEEEPDVGELEL